MSEAGDTEIYAKFSLGDTLPKNSQTWRESSMIDRLQAVVLEAAKLSAIIWEEALEEREWERIVAKPSVRGALECMAAEALKEDAAGNTENIEGDMFI